MPEKTKVIYILGYGHSGSTLLDIILGHHDRIVSVGELAEFDPCADASRAQCSCGRTHRQCAFWRRIAERFQGALLCRDTAFQTLPPTYFDNWSSPISWHRLFHQHRQSSARYRKYQNDLRAIYQFILELSGCPVVVDSSKSPCRAASLAWLRPAIDVRFIHLVRDGRAVSWSMIRKRQRKGKAPLTSRQQRQVLLRTLCGWIMVNLQAELVGRQLGRGRYLRIRYEDLFADQPWFFNRVAGIIGEDLDGLLRIVASGGELKTGHIVAGNKIRRQARVTLRPDLEWRHKLPRRYRRLFRLLGGWMLRRYGYR